MPEKVAKKAVMVAGDEGTGPGRGNGNHLMVPGVGPAMRAVQRAMTEIAPTDIAVLLVGESGTGKDVIAAQIHRLSHRSNEPFIKLSCAALTPESLNGNGEALGARNNGAPPRFSHQGTIFLDELGELDAGCQSKLLSALPDGEPGPHNHRLGARLICSTTRNLEEEMRAGRFREELYYRINGVCLRLPPLRHRKEDIPALLDYFLTTYAAQFARPCPTLSLETQRRLLEYSWPGNIRELENTVKKIVAFGDDGAALADLLHAQLVSRPVHSAIDSAFAPPGEGNLSLKQAARAASRQAERELILKVLARTRWNRKRAAQELQISYKALLYKLKQIGLEDQAAC